MGRIEDRCRCNKIAAKTSNPFIILLQQLNTMAVTPKQIDLVSHNGIFSAGTLIVVVCDKDSHGNAYKRRPIQYDILLYGNNIPIAKSLSARVPVSARTYKPRSGLHHKSGIGNTFLLGIYPY
jgi:hypothetical protein